MVAARPGAMSSARERNRRRAAASRRGPAHWPGEREALARQMQPRHGLAHGPAMARLRTPDPHALEEGDERGGLARQLAQHAAVGIAHRRRAVDARLRQMLHQAEEERQIGRRHPLLVEGQEERALLGVHQIVGVLDALGDALVGQQRAQIVAGDELSQIVVGDFGVNRHDGSVPQSAVDGLKARRPPRAARAAR